MILDASQSPVWTSGWLMTLSDFLILSACKLTMIILFLPDPVSGLHKANILNGVKYFLTIWPLGCFFIISGHHSTI
jgi:hypothetical protein